MKVYPDKFLEKIAPEDREEMGRSGMTSAEGAVIGSARLERKDLHNPFSNFLLRNRYEHVHANPVKKSTIETGWPDYTLLPLDGPAFFIEWKLPNGPLTDAQKRVFMRLIAAGHELHIMTVLKDGMDLCTKKFSKVRAP